MYQNHQAIETVYVVVDMPLPCSQDLLFECCISSIIACGEFDSIDTHLQWESEIQVCAPHWVKHG